MRRCPFVCAMTLAALLLPSAVSAAPIYNYAYGGVFTRDDQVQVMYFYLDAVSDVKIYTLSYSGGSFIHDAQSQTTLTGSEPGGGFIPVLSLYAIAGSNQLVSGGLSHGGYGSGTPQGGVDVLYGPNQNLLAHIGEGEAFIELTLDPGLYLVALSQDGNEPPDPFDLTQFTQYGNGNYTSAACDTADPFCYHGDVHFTGAWGVEILDVSGMFYAVPEPGTWMLLLGGLLILGLWWRRWRVADLASAEVPITGLTRLRRRCSRSE